MLVAALALAGCQLVPTALRGTVTADAGSYAGGVVVSVYANDDETLVAETASSAIGTFDLGTGELPAGVYRVRIGDRWWPDAASWEDAAPVHVGDDGNASTDLALASEARLTGTIVDEAGAPVANVLVAATPVDGTSVVASVLTGADGTFALGLLERGEHRLALADLNDPATAQVIALGGVEDPLTASTAVEDDVALGRFFVATGLPAPAPVPTVSLTYETTTNPSYCGAVVQVQGFEPDRTYEVSMHLTSLGYPYTDTVLRSLTTDGNGAFSGRVLTYFEGYSNTFTAEVDGVFSPAVLVDC